jgi:hypothetical protein
MDWFFLVRLLSSSNNPLVVLKNYADITSNNNYWLHFNNSGSQVDNVKTAKLPLTAYQVVSHITWHQLISSYQFLSGYMAWKKVFSA